MSISGASSTAAAPPFGRVATDSNRLDRIAIDRQRPAGELLDGIEGGLRRASAFVERLTAADLDRAGFRPTRGDVRVADAIERFLVAHLEADSLEDLIAALANDLEVGVVIGAELSQEQRP